ncbi:MAG: hypothetical protein R3B48_14935 [Kofleriaceae bacterium]
MRLGEVAQQVTLLRMFAQTITATGHRLGQVDDTRVLSGECWRRRFRFKSGATAGEVQWTLSLLRLDHDVARQPDELVRPPIAAAGDLATAQRTTTTIFPFARFSSIARCARGS